ncbi:hypothetical protein Q9306_23480 [Bacillus sp. WLY-B-L8]|nr:hypothetical protein [Bacillus sp. WLY-B-L8]
MEKKENNKKEVKNTVIKREVLRLIAFVNEVTICAKLVTKCLEALTNLIGEMKRFLKGL